MSDEFVEIEGIDTSAVPSGMGCVECMSGDGTGWWMHLRRCAHCGHIGCCDSSPSQNGLNGFASGAGGAGASGIFLVTTYF